jgi:predicted RNA methylase
MTESLAAGRTGVLARARGALAMMGAAHVKAAGIDMEEVIAALENISGTVWCS